VNRLIVILTLSVVATGLVSRTQHTGRAASNAEAMKNLYSSRQNVVPHNATAFCNAEAYVFHWRITMPPDQGCSMFRALSGRVPPDTSGGASKASTVSTWLFLLAPTMVPKCGSIPCRTSATNELPPSRSIQDPRHPCHGRVVRCRWARSIQSGTRSRLRHRRATALARRDLRLQGDGHRLHVS